MPESLLLGLGSSTTVEPLRVLIVEDEHDAASSLQMMVEQWGHATRVCGMAYEALALAPYFKPNVVLIDIGLPDIDGWELARKLGRESDAIMIAVTARGEHGDFSRSIKSGIDFHLVKPAFHSQLKLLLGRINRDNSE